MNAEKSSKDNLVEEAVLRAVEEKRKEDPLIGAKLGSKEVFQRLLEAMNDEKGVHVDSLLCALGALAGYACQAGLRILAISHKLSGDAPFMVVKTADGKQCFYGNLLNGLLAEAPHSVWSIAAGAAQGAGCKALPDINEIFRHVAESVGRADFGLPRFPQGRSAGDTPVGYLKRFWPLFLPLVRKFCPNPREWHILFSIAIQNAIYASKDILPPDLALTIVMESAVPMSKLDLATA